jgi:hypothetical protein
VKILGIDPGATIGLCVYDTETRRVMYAAQFTGLSDAMAVVKDPEWWMGCKLDAIGIERARIYGAGGASVANTIEQVGWLLASLNAHLPDGKDAIQECGARMVYTLERRAVVSALTAAVGQSVKGDAGVWQALCTLHPGAAQRPVAGKPATRQKPAVDAVEAGPLYGVSSHARAALAVAWTLGQHLGK